jgi:hypothetical protein
LCTSQLQRKVPKNSPGSKGAKKTDANFSYPQCKDVPTQKALGKILELEQVWHHSFGSSNNFRTIRA